MRNIFIVFVYCHFACLELQNIHLLQFCTYFFSTNSSSLILIYSTNYFYFYSCMEKNIKVFVYCQFPCLELQNVHFCTHFFGTNSSKLILFQNINYFYFYSCTYNIIKSFAYCQFACLKFQNQHLLQFCKQFLSTNFSDNRFLVRVLNNTVHVSA